MYVHLLPEAEDDLKGIYEYIARRNLPRAESFVQELLTKAEALAHMPDAYPFLGHSDLRRRLHGNYRILFRLKYELGRIDVVRILHSAMDVDLLEIQ